MYGKENSPLIFNTENMDPSERFTIITGPPDGNYNKYAKMLYDKFNYYRKVVLTKTKPQESSETSGVDGYFVSKQVFSEMVGDGKFLFYRSLPDGNYEGLSHWHASNSNDWNRPLVHSCDFYEAKNFKGILKDRCNIVYLNEISNIVISLEENSGVSYVVNNMENSEFVIEKLENVIQTFHNDDNDEQ